MSRASTPPCRRVAGAAAIGGCVQREPELPSSRGGHAPSDHQDGAVDERPASEASSTAPPHHLVWLPVWRASGVAHTTAPRRIRCPRWPRRNSSR